MAASERSALIVGAGIAGLANAWSAARRGFRVTVVERSAHASGGSVRNFGMIWPIGQSAGECHQIALRSRQAWLEVAREAQLWLNPCGSIHLAHRADEWAVIDEFAARSRSLGYSCELLTPDDVLARSPGTNPHGLRGGLFSPTEMCVHPRKAIPTIAQWLASRWQVEFHFQTTAVGIDDHAVVLADGTRRSADRVAICGGADFETLYPNLFASSGLKRCKLQMLKTVPQPPNWKLGPHLASGLTLRHYPNFSVCPSLRQLKQRVAQDAPELDRFGIHVMASQNDAGEVILGDSHEYDEAIEPFDKTQIDEWMLRELRQLIQLPDWTIAERWHGIYAKNPHGPLFESAPAEHVRVMTGLGGSGMTMSFGLAERLWDNWS